MDQLRLIREKLSWEILAFIVIYVAAAVVLGLVYLPARNKSKDYMVKLDNYIQNEQSLRMIINQKPQLEVKRAEVEEQLRVLAGEIPSQYDLAEVLEGLEQTAAHYGLAINDLDHVPLKAGKTDSTGIIPLSFKVQGDQAVFAYLLHLGELLPSLKLTEMSLGYQGEERFQLEAKADLQVFVLDKAPLEPLQLAQFAQVKQENLALGGFGLPFEIVGEYLQGQVQVLGVVAERNQSSALLAKDGIKQWVKVGDHVGDAVVSAISQGTVWLDLDGVTLRLTIRG